MFGYKDKKAEFGIASYGELLKLILDITSWMVEQSLNLIWYMPLRKPTTPCK